jgi:hypothetical protein
VGSFIPLSSPTAYQNLVVNNPVYAITLKGSGFTLADFFTSVGKGSTIVTRLNPIAKWEFPSCITSTAYAVSVGVFYCFSRAGLFISLSGSEVDKTNQLNHYLL